MTLAAKNLMMALLVSFALSKVSGQRMRGFDSQVTRRLASSGRKCWSWCNNGHCSWNWGCQCICDSNYEGVCCNDMVLCGPMRDACPQDMLTSKSVEISSLLDNDGKFRTDLGPRVQTQGPEALQGLFWLTNQGDSSSLASFAKSNDGGDMGQGELKKGDYAISIRVGGDRSWSFADAPGGNFETVELLDLVYHFRLESGSLKKPTGFRILPEARNLGITLEGGISEWLLDFSMHKMSDEDARAQGFPGSIVWDRTSAVGGQDVDSARYALVQVVDGNRRPIEPAYSQWVAHQKSKDAGSSPGKIHYREALSNDGSL